MRRTLAVLLLVSVFVVMPARVLVAQATRADSAAVLLDAAKRLQLEGNANAAAAVADEILRRFADTPAALEVRAWRRSSGVTGESSGRLELVAWGTIYGAWLGIAVPLAAGAEGSGAYGIGLIVGAPAGYIATRAYADANRPTLGQARAMTLGFRWGAWQVAGWYGALDPNASGRSIVTATIVGGFAGMTAAALYGRHRTMPVGVVAAAAQGSYWGMWFGLMGSGLFDVGGDAIFKVVLAAGDLGLVGEALLVPRDISQGRVWMITAAGWGGAAIGGGLDLLLQPEGKTALLIPTLTSAAGLALGLTQAARADERQALGPDRPAHEATALVQVDEAGRRLGLPLPTPTLALVGEHLRRRVYRPAMALSLFRAEF